MSSLLGYSDHNTVGLTEKCNFPKLLRFFIADYAAIPP